MAGGGTGSNDRRHDAIQRGRLQGEHRDIAGQPARRPRDRLVGHRAHRAQLLGDDEVGAQLAQEPLVETVQARAGVDRPADVPVDVGAGAPLVADGA